MNWSSVPSKIQKFLSLQTLHINQWGTMFQIIPFLSLLNLPICWKPDKKGFTMSGYYKLLHCNGNQSFPWKYMWKSRFLLELISLFWQIASRVVFFVWKILTIDNLRKIYVAFRLVLCVSAMGNQQIISYFIVL